MISAPLFNKPALLIHKDGRIEITKVNCSGGLVLTWKNGSMKFPGGEYNQIEGNGRSGYYDLLYPGTEIDADGRVIVRLAGDVVKEIINTEKGEFKLPGKIEQPTIIEAAGNKPKIIKEFIGRVNSNTGELSIARMKSPSGWEAPGQTPEFDEYTIVLNGMLRVDSKTGSLDINAGEAVIVKANEWVCYITPGKYGAEYMAVCLPAFSPDTVHRDEK